MNARILGLGMLLVLSPSCMSPAPAPKPTHQQAAIPAVRATEPLRPQYAGIRAQLERLNGLVDALPRTAPQEQGEAMRRIAELLGEMILRHTGEERDRLYMAADRCAGNAPHRFTTSLSHEQALSARWLEALSAEAGRPSPDVTAFSRGAQRLLGLLDAHFQTEEAVLLPLLDGAMTPDQFRRDVMEGEASPLPPPSPARAPAPRRTC